MYKMADCNHANSMSCSACTRFRAKIQGMRNFSPAFIEGMQNLQASSFKDHASSEMHKRSWMLLKRSNRLMCASMPICADREGATQYGCWSTADGEEEV